MMWKVLGMYGEIVAVKLLFKYAGCAIVQFKSKESAADVISNLNGLRVYGQQWEVKESKNANAMHWDGANTELQKRMCTITDEGVKPPVRPKKFNMFRPNSDLVLTGLPGGITETGIKNYFDGFQAGAQRGPERVEVVDDQDDGGGSQAFLSFKSTEDALLAVAETNGVPMDLGSAFPLDCKMHFNRPKARQAPPPDVGRPEPGPPGPAYDHTTMTPHMPPGVSMLGSTEADFGGPGRRTFTA